MTIGNMITFCAVIVALISLLVTLVQYGKNVRHDRRKDTLDAYNTLQREALDELYISYTDESVREISERGDEPEFREVYNRLSTLLARIEHFCVGVNSRIYDWETVFELSHGFLDTTIARRIRPLMEEKWKNPHFNPYANTEKVIEKLRNEAERRKKKEISSY